MLIKKLCAVFFTLQIIVYFAYSSQAIDVSARACVVIDCETLQIIYEHNPNEKLSMASTTKIMTALLAVESGRLSCPVTAKRDILCEGTAIGIKKGDCLTLETLVYAMLLESGNDAAILSAEYLCSDEKSFAVAMNSKAKVLGMWDTNFVTSSGLDSSEHYTTAYDMALLGAFAVKNPIFKEICSCQKAEIEYISPSKTQSYYNHNRLLRECDGVFGIKTGYTKKSGRCLVTACEREGTTLVAVTLNAPDDWNDHKKLYDYCFEEIDCAGLSVSVPEKIKLYSSDCSHIMLTAPEISLIIDEDSSYETRIILPEFIYAPVSEGDIIGSVQVLNNKRLIGSYPITACESAQVIEGSDKPEFTFRYKLKSIIEKLI